MELTEDKLRNIIREELNVQMGRTQPPRNSLGGYMNRFIEDTAKRFASALQSQYDIEFQKAILGDRSFNADFQVYNSRQDMMKEGKMYMFVRDGSVTIQIEGGPLGAGVSGMNQFVDETIGYNEDPMNQIDIVSAFQVLAGR